LSDKLSVEEKTQMEGDVFEIIGVKADAIERGEDRITDKLNH